MALAGCLLLIVLLFLADRRVTQGSWALVIPGLWFFILCSRAPNVWLSPEVADRVLTEGDSLEGGGPMNSLVFGGLIASAFIVLFRRRFQWSTLFYRNKSNTAMQRKPDNISGSEGIVVGAHDSNT